MWRLQAGPDLQAACDAGRPYFVTTCYRGLARTSSVYPYDKDAPSVVVFADTPDDDPYYVAATLEQVGAIWGLAYSSEKSAVYAAAFHKTQLPFGPGGPGAIYRIDLLTGSIVHFLTVPNAGPNRHEKRIRWDAEGEPWAGRTSLGDIDISADESELYVTNLNDRRIYRFAMSSGQLLGSFDHGAAGESWAAEARPFALAYRDGLLYHALVRTAEESGNAADLEARVYRSLPDGSEMSQVSAIHLDYDRGVMDTVPGLPGNSLDWQPWRDTEYSRRDSGYSLAPMPLLSDIVFDDRVNMVIGIRDRHMDAARHFHRSSGEGGGVATVGLGAGDILYGARSGPLWRVDTASEHFQDGLVRFGDESALGGLAQYSGGSVIVGGSYVGSPYRGDMVFSGEGAHWYEPTSGSRTMHERVCHPSAAEPLDDVRLAVSKSFAHCPPGPVLPPPDYVARSIGSIGDVEVLCREESVPPTPTPTAIPTIAEPSPTVTPTPTNAPPAATGTPRPTPTATARPMQLYLPVTLRERCDPDYQRSDIALVIDTSSSMAGQKIVDARHAALTFVTMIDLAPGRGQVAVVRYDREAEVVRELTRGRAAIEAAIRSLHVRSGTHIDKGLRTALVELQSPRHIERNTPVLILLTDGVQTGTPGEELKAAAEVRDVGVRMYAIGLGADADQVTLRTIAGADERYYFAPDSADLARIYSEIAVDLMCPGMWGGR